LLHQKFFRVQAKDLKATELERVSRCASGFLPFDDITTRTSADVSNACVYGLERASRPGAAFSARQRFARSPRESFVAIQKTRLQTSPRSAASSFPAVPVTISYDRTVSPVIGQRVQGATQIGPRCLSYFRPLLEKTSAAQPLLKPRDKSRRTGLYAVGNGDASWIEVPL